MRVWCVATSATELGSAGWQSEVGPTYGAENKVSIGGMPGFQGKLTEDELYAVVVFERVVFGSGNTATADEVNIPPVSAVESVVEETKVETAPSIPETATPPSSEDEDDTMNYFSKLVNN